MNPLLLQFPDEIVTSRLRIRPPHPEDAPRLFEAVKESLPELSPWLPWAQEPQTLEGSVIYCREAYAKFIARTDLPLLLWHVESGVLMGASGLHRIHWEVPSFEVGYWCRSAWVGKGIVSEAVHAITEFAFSTLQARRVEIRVDPRNSRSVKVAERLGFALEGLLRNSTRDVQGVLRDTQIFAKVR